MSYIPRADINLLTKPNKNMCLCCIEKLEMNLFDILLFLSIILKFGLKFVLIPIINLFIFMYSLSKV